MFLWKVVDTLKNEKYYTTWTVLVEKPSRIIWGVRLHLENYFAKADNADEVIYDVLAEEDEKDVQG